MKILGALAGAALIALASGAVANAGSYVFTFTGSNYDVSGQFTTDASNNILTASGTVTSTLPDPAGAFTFTGPGPGSGPGEDWSNVYDPSLPGFSGNGLGIEFGGSDASIYNGVSASYPACTSTCFSVYNATPGYLYNPGDTGTLSISAVPEPAAWAILLLGVGLIGSSLRLGRRKQSPAAAAI